jgi:hypothetical protein
LQKAGFFNFRACLIFKRKGRLMKKEIYVMRVNGVWCGYIPRKKFGISIIGKEGDTIGDFYKNVKEDYPNYDLRCVLNYGIEEKLRKIISISKEMS